MIPVAVSPQWYLCNYFIFFWIISRERERKHCVLKLPPITLQNDKLIEVLIGPKENYEILWTTNMEEGAQKEKREEARVQFSHREEAPCEAP